MIGKVVGALFGAEMERQRGENGLKGAAVGMVAGAVLRRMGPLGMVIGGAYVAKKALDRRRLARGDERGHGRTVDG
jgi:uncharacterized protein (DUF697 family)